jgi:hypothetical protein
MHANARIVDALSAALAGILRYGEIKISKEF